MTPSGAPIPRMLAEIIDKLCRVYPIPCPACGTESRFPRFNRDVCRVNSHEADGHFLELAWRIEGEFPAWLTPLTFFWATCDRCFFAGPLDEPDYRQWKKNERKFLREFHEGALERIQSGAGPLPLLGRGLAEADPYARLLLQFHCGVFTETLKLAPSASVLARAYLRIAWIFRDVKRRYAEIAATSPALEKLAGVTPAWNSGIIPNSGYPRVPGIATDEVGALRYALAYFEWNFATLSTAAGHEDEMRLMQLIAEIGYRIYELTGQDADFVKAQSMFSGTMQKCLSVINDKSIVGGAVNRAKDTLEKAGDRGRELRALKEKAQKRGRPPGGPLPAAPQPGKAEAPSAPARPAVAAAPPPVAVPAPEAPAAPAAPVAPSGGAGGDLHKRIAQLDEENKRWMRLAGINELTGLPNRVMMARVLLPGAAKAATESRQPLGCILVAPEGLGKINGKFGRDVGDELLRHFTECLKALIRKGERLAHLEGVNFAILVPNAPAHQLKKRAEAIHKDLSSRRFDLGGNSFSMAVSIGLTVQQTFNGSGRAALDAFYKRSVQALDVAKLKGNQVEFLPEE